MYMIKMMNKSPLMLLLLLSLLFSSFDAHPTSRRLKWNKPNSGIQDLGTQEVGGGGEASGRMDLEYTDYPGTGANNRHDPRTPGRG